MRVLPRRLVQRSGAVLAAIGYTVAAAAAADTIAGTLDAGALSPGESLAVDLSKADRVRLRIAAGMGPVGIDIVEAFVTLEVTVDGAGDAGERLRSASAGDVPIRVLVAEATPVSLTLHVVYRDARSPSARVTVHELTDDTLAPYATEAALSRLGVTPGDGALQRGWAAAESAAALWRAAGRDTDAATATLAAASLARQVGDPASALRLARQAADALEAAGLPTRAGLALNLAGLAHIDRRDADGARRALQRARAALEPLYADVAVNPADSNLCFLDLVTGNSAAAERCYRELIALAERAGDTDAVARYRNNLGGAFSRRGDADAALAHYRAALAFATDPRQKLLRARLLNNSAIELRRLGRPEEALDLYQQALHIAREIGDRSQVTLVLNNLSVTYGDLGAPHQALPFLAEAYELNDAPDTPAAMRAAYNYGGALRDAGELDRAGSVLDEAIDRARRIGDARGLSMALRLAAGVRLDTGDVARAETLARAAVETAQLPPGEPRVLAQALTVLADALMEAGRPGPAQRLLERAIGIWDDVGDPYGSVMARTMRARALWRSGNAGRAGALASGLIDDIETLRTGIASPDLRAGYQSGLSEAYEITIYGLMAEGDADAALRVAERYRAKTLVDVLSRAGPELASSAPEALRKRRASILAQINKAEDDRLRGRAAPPITPMLAELDVIDGRIAAADPRYRAARDTTPVDTLEMRALHGDAEITLVYFLGRERSYAWLVDAQGTSVATLPRAAHIEEAARALHEAVSRRRDSATLAARLGRELLQPFAGRIAAADTVAIVADRALHYVPFDVLTAGDGGPPLLARHELAYLPSLTSVALSRRLPPPSGRGVTVLADPVFGGNDTRAAAAPAMRGGERALNRLRLTQLEAEAIRAEAGSLPVNVYTGFAARPAVLRSDATADAAIVHIATHGFADDKLPARSGLALSMIDANGDPTTGFVGLRDIYGLRLDADLVVLSACETALGRDLAGDGLLGLTRGFMYAGARRVVATLWRVEDRATAELMRRFYAGLFAGAPPARALADAKAALRADRRFRHPYYWSGFTLQGDWRASGWDSAGAGDSTGASDLRHGRVQ